MQLREMPALRALENYPERLELRCLFADMDSFRHINNGSIGRYFEEARATVNAMIFGKDSLINPDAVQLLFANSETDFIAQVRYPGSVQIGTGVLKIGSSSWTLVQGIFQDGACCALNRSVLVKARKDKSTPLDAGERATMERFLLIGIEAI